MRSLLLIAALLVSSSVAAQTTTFAFTTPPSPADTVTFGKSRCGDEVGITYARSSTLAPCSSLLVWVTPSASCPTAPVSGDYSVTEISQTTLAASLSGTFNVSLSKLPFTTAADGGTSGCDANTDELTFRLCGAITSRDVYGNCATTASSVSGLKFTFDGQPPDAPTINSASGLDKAISVSVSAPDDAISVRLTVLLDGAQVAEVSQAVGAGSLVVKGLENDLTYQVQAYASDAAGNESLPSATTDVTPIKTVGFVELYEGAGGTTGCGVAGGGLAGGGLLAALGLWLFSRRNRSWFEQ